MPEFLSDLPRDYTVLSDQNGNVTNLVANALLPQRSILFGLGVALAVLILLSAFRETGAARPLAAAAVLVGLLPMAHPHSFLVCLAVLAGLAGEHDQFATPADVALADWVRSNTDPHDVFIGTDRPNTPVATLAGRPVVMGYRGWLLNFSVPYGEREAAVRASLTGRVDDPAVRKFDPRYLVVGWYEGDAWPVDRRSLAALPVAYKNGEWTVYRLTGPVSQLPATPADR